MSNTEHIEDEILNFGVDGARSAINFMQAVRDMLAGNSKSSIRMTVKWDGAPAVFAGTDPTDGKFFVGKKSVFNVNPILYKTEKDIRENAKGSLQEKFSIALNEFSKLGIKGKVLQGDLLYVKSDLETKEIDGEECYIFQPNTIVYCVPVNSDLGQKIARSNIGVVWHTTYEGESLPEMKASFGADISGLKKTPTVWMNDAKYQDVSGSAKMTASETDEVTKVLSMTGKTLRKVNSGMLNDFNTLQKTFTGDLSGANVKTFFNTFVRAGKLPSDPRKFTQEYIDWVTSKFDAKIDKIKSEMHKKKYQTMKDTTLQQLTKHTRNLEQVIAFQILIIRAKMLLLKKLNSIRQLAGTMIKTKDGYEVTNAEGFVAIDRLKGNAVKLVDRMEFSYNNFNAIRSWDA